MPWVGKSMDRKATIRRMREAAPCPVCGEGAGQYKFTRQDGEYVCINCLATPTPGDKA